MTKYELLYIIPGKYSEGELPPIINNVKELIAKEEGQLASENDLGKKKLAYPIQDSHYGYYILDIFTIEGEKINKIEKALRLMPEILRHQIVLYVDPSKTTGRAPRIKPTAESRPAPSFYGEKITPSEQPTLGELVERKPEEKKDKPSKVSLDELDKKLDEILKNDII